MTSFRRMGWAASAVMLALALAGCSAGGDNPADEVKEPHFLSGKALAERMDYQGAMDAFEESLEVNPRSAAAHFELGLLCQNKADDPAAAIYHYERYLKLRPKAQNADVARQLINACKMELAKGAAIYGGAPGNTQQTDMQKLVLENRDLRDRLDKWQLFYASLNRVQTFTNAQTPAPIANNPQPVAQAAPLTTARADTSRQVTGTRTGAPTVTAVNRTRSAPGGRTHAVKSGESFYSISRKYGVSLSALTAANPQASPTRLKVGEMLVVPGS